MSKIYFPQSSKGKAGIEIREGLAILDFIRQAGIEIHAECSGKGTCGKCIVRVEKGKRALFPALNPEKRFLNTPDERLACCAKIMKDTGDMSVFIKASGVYKILSSSKKRKIKLDPAVYAENGKVLHYSGEILGNYESKIYGLAADVGTTTLVFELIDLETGETILNGSRVNPQVVYGNDVISRIEYTIVDKKKNVYLSKDESLLKLGELQRCIINGFNSFLSDIERSRGEKISDFIYEVVITGNPAMRDAVLGIDISPLGLLPYEPVTKGEALRKAKDIGLEINPGAVVYGAPLIGGQVGSDITGDILASEIYKSNKIGMILDIGTNCEIVIGNSSRLLSAAYPAGGAFEGAGMLSGMGAISGAITDIEIKNVKASYHTIDDAPAAGICGSGLIDLLAELLNHGIMSKDAKLKADYQVTNKIRFTQHDVNQLIVAKAGLRTYTDLLIKYYGIKTGQVDKFYLSGAFGNYINVKNAMKIGLLPEIDENKIVKIGNGSLEGAREILLSVKSRRKAADIAKTVENVRPNEIEKDFMYLFADRMYF